VSEAALVTTPQATAPPLTAPSPAVERDWYIALSGFYTSVGMSGQGSHHAGKAAGVMETGRTKSK